MRVDEARALLANLGSEYARHDQAFANETLVPGFDAASDTDKARILEAAETLVVDGDQSDKSLAAGFLESVPSRADLWPRLVGAYARSGCSDGDPLAALLGNSWPFLDDASVDALERLFLDKPARQLNIARAIVNRRTVRVVWDALIAVARASADPVQLQLVSRAMGEVERFGEFIDIMRAKPRAVQEATAKRLSSAHYNEFITALGISGR